MYCPGIYLYELRKIVGKKKLGRAGILAEIPTKKILNRILERYRHDKPPPLSYVFKHGVGAQ
jgi:hypothetical protein